MARERPNGLLVAAALAGLLGVGGVGVGCGENPVPERPGYSSDIKPLMEAHCIRCHGAGGTLNADPDSTPTSGVQKPMMSDFTALADDAAGNHGLAYYAGPNGGAARMRAFIRLMPPAPAEPLTDRENEIIQRWIDNPLP